MKTLYSLVLAGAAGVILFAAGVSVGRNTRLQEQPSKDNAATNAAEVAALPVATNAPAVMKVLRVRQSGDNEITFVLSQLPDMEAVRSYVSVEPAPVGGLSFSSHGHSLSISGDFAFRTDHRLTVRAGLPIKGAAGSGGMERDFVYDFRRKDLEAQVDFTANGRYLPPIGARALEVEAVNAPLVRVALRRVEPRNVVQLLAREEDVYSHRWGNVIDACETVELSGEEECQELKCRVEPNKPVKFNVPVVMNDGGASNGIYLVSLGPTGCSECDRTYRVVCVSDLGLSVRKSGKDGIGVWVTSLSTGETVGDAWIEVYSASNVKIMEGRTDSNGWCAARRIARGEPFAVVAIAPDADDMTFMALRDSMKVDETNADGARRKYLAGKEVEAFVWTDRGIYRHGERIFLHSILRDADRKAPRQFPVELTLTSPKGRVLSTRTVMPGILGSLDYEGFEVPPEHPSGVWTIKAKIPGEDGRVLGSCKVKVEEFAPPQIRVRVETLDDHEITNFAFAVSAEHLFGGPAHGLSCEGAVVFEDASFAPSGWEGWRFGDEDRGIVPNFRRLNVPSLDRDGRCVVDASMPEELGLPKAAVKVTAQGTVFEDGGRPATARRSVVLHYYPYYIASDMRDCLQMKRVGGPVVRFACVGHDGKRLPHERRLVMKLERIDSVYSYRKTVNGWYTWDCDRVRSTVADGLLIEIPASANAEVALPIDKPGDYAVIVTDPENNVSFSRSFYLGGLGDREVRSPLSNPSKVSVVPDRKIYRVGERPRLILKSPFTGNALITVMRDKMIHSKVVALTNATQVVELNGVDVGDAPSVDVYVSVVQGVRNNSSKLAVRAHGQTTLSIRPLENEIPVMVDADVRVADCGSEVTARIAAPGAEQVVVTLVDEGINLLTGESIPDPIGYFAAPREANHPLFDLYHRMLPVIGEDLPRASGIQTGGGIGAELLGRVSPTPTRRFRPLAMWKSKVPVVNGNARVEFKLPEFVGEVRITVLAYNRSAVGAAAITRKVTPKLVSLPDAPRFAAPEDMFDVSLPVFNRSGSDGDFGYEIYANGKMVASAPRILLAKEASTNIVVSVRAMSEPGEMILKFHLRGMGEVHEQLINLPIRPAVAWRETAGVRKLLDGERFVPDEGRFRFKEFETPLAGLHGAFSWLADYPYGCLEQTSSRVFPLVFAEGLPDDLFEGVMCDRGEFVKLGMRRVESMIRAHDFVMWPDCNYAPWNREVSIYAAHFLFEAEVAGYAIDPAARNVVLGFLSRWAMSTNSMESAYACQVLAVARKPERDRMYRLFDDRESLAQISRARLARAFANIHDRRRAETLLENVVAPSSVKEAAFVMLALLDLSADEEKLLPLVEYLNDARGARRNCWKTTEDNAHALMALGAYHRKYPPRAGERYVAWRKLELPRLEELTDEDHGISITRRFLSPEGGGVDLMNLKCGEMVMVELILKSMDTRVLNDLVIEDLFAACFEPVHQPLQSDDADWVMRSDARDDRMLVFSKKFDLEKNHEVKFRYALRVVSAGEFVLPGASAEGMYDPALRSRRAPGRIVVRR